MRARDRKLKNSSFLPVRPSALSLPGAVLSKQPEMGHFIPLPGLSILSCRQDISFVFPTDSFKMHIFRTLFDIETIMLSEICFQRLQEKNGAGCRITKIGKGWYLIYEHQSVNHYSGSCIHSKVSIIQNIIQDMMGRNAILDTTLRTLMSSESFRFIW